MTFVHDETNWETASSACSTNGGVLFNQLNGTTEQLDFFFQRLNKPQCFWMGMILVNQQWVLLPDNKPISDDLIIWGKNQPGDEMIVATKTGGFRSTT